MKTANNIEKPIAKWEILDVLQYCNAIKLVLKSCKECKLYNLCNTAPSEWNLIDIDKVVFSEEEKAIARVLNTALPGGLSFIEVKGCENYVIEIRAYFNDGNAMTLINKDSFPSARVGQTYHYRDIVGDDRKPFI